MDHQPPPFFNRGPAPLARLSFYAMLSLALLFVDSRFRTLELVRQSLSLLTQPIQQVAHAPAGFIQKWADYFSDLSRLKEESVLLKRDRLLSGETLLRTRALEAENERLRRLLEVRELQKIRGRVAQIIYAPRDPFSRRIVVDKGQQDLLSVGQPVVDDAGVVGQVTRVFPFVSEITLITDQDQAVPVQILRTGQRSVVFGLGDGRLELRFLPTSADVRNGDVLLTSGLDGVFPRGLPVAKVLRVERDATYTFARVYCQPFAGVENFSEVMVLDRREALAVPEGIEQPATSKPAAKTDIRRRMRRQ
jgi:rod shape-determining protein MreC